MSPSRNTVTVENNGTDEIHLGEWDHLGKRLRVVLGSTEDRRVVGLLTEPTPPATATEPRMVFSPVQEIPSALWKKITASPAGRAINGLIESGAIRAPRS